MATNRKLRRLARLGNRIGTWIVVAVLLLLFLCPLQTRIPQSGHGRALIAAADGPAADFERHFRDFRGPRSSHLIVIA